MTFWCHKTVGIFKQLKTIQTKEGLCYSQLAMYTVLLLLLSILAIGQLYAKFQLNRSGSVCVIQWQKDESPSLDFIIDHIYTFTLPYVSTRPAENLILKLIVIV